MVVFGDVQQQQHQIYCPTATVDPVQSANLALLSLLVFNCIADHVLGLKRMEMISSSSSGGGGK